MIYDLSTCACIGEQSSIINRKSLNNPCQFRSSTSPRCANGKSATWAAGQTEAEVIRRVGEKIAQRALQLTRAGDAILILAGKGHNGDDARAAREHLRDRRVEVLDVTDPEAALAEFQRRTGIALPALQDRRKPVLR